MAKNRENNHDPLLGQRAICDRYGVTKKLIDKYFPKPIVRYNPRNRYAYSRAWRKSDVERALALPELQRELALLNEERLRNRQREEIRDLLMAYTPDSLIEKAKGLRRVFVLHVGPTNSGKTHDAVEALMKASSGTYLGPLRLLALEMFDRINAAGIPCSLLTGEEHIPVEGAGIVASTVELCDYNRRFDVAVIDEAQLITDPDRGPAWFSALCGVNAAEVHICLAPEAENYVVSLVRQFGDPYNVVRHERLVPLVYSGRCRGYRDIKPHDALICFSRKNVLSTAALLERNGFKASVIYGALPPAARRSEVAKYTSGITNVIVATDAIGMGITLPIKRVIFAETHKFDGKQQRPLNSGEIRQIAGRAGRFGMFDLGEVLTMDSTDVVEKGMSEKVPRTRMPCVAFPREALDTDYPIDLLLKVWRDLPPSGAFLREEVGDAVFLYGYIRESAAGKDRQLVYDLITCPVDTGLQELVGYWASCARAILRGRHIPAPPFDTETLEGCELQYKAYDVHHQLMSRIGREDDCSSEREEICRIIDELMSRDKSAYIRSCRVCGRELPLGFGYNVCERCRRRMYE